MSPVNERPTGFWTRIKHTIFGSPISSENVAHTLLPKSVALPVYASDAISSTAYATQQIVLALGGAGLWVSSKAQDYTQFTMMLTGVIVLILAVVVTSYCQTIFAYPKGGGSYIVSKDNLGARIGLVAGAALLIDYVLTVAVSIAAGVQNLANVPLPDQIKWLNFGNLILWSLIFIGILTFLNLRGLKESGLVFSLPSYAFIFACYLMIFLGAFGEAFGWKFHLGNVNQEYHGHIKHNMETAGLVVLLTAFANGCSAMTGTEAVSDGIPNFKEPKAKNAAITLVMMGLILGSIFLGISYLATKFHVVYWEKYGKTSPAVFDQISSAIYGKEGPTAWLYYFTQLATTSILVLAANTAFADFPRVASLLARDRFLPKQFANQGDKLVFNNGIMILGLSAALLIYFKGGSVDRLIPLYAVGVFTAFTLSQSGMVARWLRLKDTPHRTLKLAINIVGALSTFIVLIVIAVEKFFDGAWLVIVFVPLIMWMCWFIRRHYLGVGEQLKMKGYVAPVEKMSNTVVLLVPGLHRGVMPAIEYARLLSDDCRAVYVNNDPEKADTVQHRWEEYVPDVPLVVIASPYRSLLSPIMRYLDAVQKERNNHKVTVVIPEFVPSHWWQNLLHGNTGLILKAALLGRKDIVVANVRYYLQDINTKLSEDALSEERVEPVAQTDTHKPH